MSRTTAVDNARKEGDMQAHPMLAAEIVYKGMPVFLKATGRLAFMNDGTTNALANGDVFAGIAAETMDNSAGAASAKSVRVYMRGNFQLPIAGTLTQAKVGDAVYSNNVSDDDAVTLTSDSGNPEVRIGTVSEFLSAALGYVFIDQHVLTKVAAAA